MKFSFFVGGEMDHLLVFNPVRLCNSDSDSDCILRGFASCKQNAFDPMKAGRQLREFVAEQVFLSVIPFRRRLKCQEAAERFQPLHLWKVVVEQPQTKALQLSFRDAEHNLMCASRQCCSELLKRSRQDKPIT